jgi:hypothetical protein
MPPDSAIVVKALDLAQLSIMRDGALLYLGAKPVVERASARGAAGRSRGDGYEALLTSGEGWGVRIPVRSATETASANDPT